MQLQDSSIYAEMARRTGGSISMGIVGPVRTGKSTLIKKIMEKTVLPAMPEEASLRKNRIWYRSSGTVRNSTTARGIPIVPGAAAGGRM